MNTIKQLKEKNEIIPSIFGGFPKLDTSDWNMSMVKDMTDFSNWSEENIKTYCDGLRKLVNLN